jgi:Cdc6-like AAA superfamily ATPase
MSHDHAETQPAQIAGEQPIIRTSEVERCSILLRWAAFSNERTGYNSIGLFTGPRGVGKSSSVAAFMQEMGMENSSLLPPYIAFEAEPGSTPRALANSIYHCLGETSQPRQTRSDIVKGIKDVLRNNLVRLIIIDEADRLNNLSLDVVRSITDDKECRISVALFGIDELRSIVENDKRLKDRIYPCMKFEAPKLDEVLNTILPQIVMPRWEYDLGDNGCIEMGEYIYKLAGSSIRKMRILIQSASHTAQDVGDEKITMETLKFHLILLTPGLLKNHVHRKTHPNLARKRRNQKLEKGRRSDILSSIGSRNIDDGEL